tara:strand:- start:2087 stop:2563 length:477 start_codon:yes stop_codon:yes gene_type:complete
MVNIIWDTDSAGKRVGFSLKLKGGETPSERGKLLQEGLKEIKTTHSFPLECETFEVYSKKQHKGNSVKYLFILKMKDGTDYALKIVQGTSKVPSKWSRGQTKTFHEVRSFRPVTHYPTGSETHVDKVPSRVMKIAQRFWKLRERDPEEERLSLMWDLL